MMFWTRIDIIQRSLITIIAVTWIDLLFRIGVVILIIRTTMTVTIMIILDQRWFMLCSNSTVLFNFLSFITRLADGCKRSWIWPLLPFFILIFFSSSTDYHVLEEPTKTNTAELFTLAYHSLLGFMTSEFFPAFLTVVMLGVLAEGCRI